MGLSEFSTSASMSEFLGAHSTDDVLLAGKSEASAASVLTALLSNLYQQRLMIILDTIQRTVH